MAALNQERLVGDILRTSFEAVTFTDLDEQILPLIDELCDTSLSMMYRCNDRRELISIGGDLEAHNRYVEKYRFADPMQSALLRSDARIFRAPRCPEWKEFLNAPVYHEHAQPRGIDNYIHLRLTEGYYLVPGSAGMILARSCRQPDFSEGDEHLLVRILPSLEALVRRLSRVEDRLKMPAVLETVLSLNSSAKIACDIHGRLLWASEIASEWLGLRRPKRELSALLFEAVRRVGALDRFGPDAQAPIPQVRLACKNGASVLAELRLARTSTGSPFVLIELQVPKLRPELAEVAARFRLTLAECHVLEALARGLSDRQISRELYVSLPTVRTHVGRILSKMGVASRIQAALLAHGLPH